MITILLLLALPAFVALCIFGVRILVIRNDRRRERDRQARVQEILNVILEVKDEDKSTDKYLTSK